MDVPSVRYRRIGQRQAPAGQIAKTCGVAEHLNNAVYQIDTDRSTFDRCHDSDLTAIARDRQRDLIHGVSMAR